MVSASMRQFLQSLCNASPWDYAVLWRLQLHQDQALLTWDDGVFDVSKPRKPTETVMDYLDPHCSGDTFFSTYPLINQSGDWVDSSPIAVLVAEMSSIHYVVGKGVVGEAAHTEASRWIYADSIMCGGFNFCPDELLHHFVAGIKTILLVPLVPYGVLQLGSLDKVAEDAELVFCIKNKFDADQQFAGYFSFFSSERKFLVQTSADMRGHAKTLGELSDNAVDRTNKDLSFLGSVAVESNRTLNVDEMMRKVSDCVSESKIRSESGTQSDVKECPSYPFHALGESNMKQNFLGSAFQEEDLDVFSYFSDFEMMHSKISINNIMEAIPNSLGERPPVADCDYSNHDNGRNFLRFPSDCELHKALGPVVSDHADLDTSHSDFTVENAGRSSVCNKDSIHFNQPAAWDSGGRSEEGYKVEDLLEVVLANGRSIADDDSTNRSPTAISLKASQGNLWSCNIAHVISEGEDLVPCVTSASSGDKDSSNISPSPSSFDCVISALLKEKLQREGKGSMCPAKGLKPTGANKRRTRPGDNQKPRPRDRQLIQERIKELRELVPNSAKCSIDSLLDRTIKHMQFLRSVTDQADKVKPHVKDKASECKTLKSPLAKGNDRNGTSWAVELGGSDHQKCPIVVKDLESPGHMLIEMLCGDHGRFLEIADVIHRLDLTILNGLMEKRTDDCTWAHFIVEASGSFHRLDIFWPLMQLLQQNRTQISSRI